MRWFKFYGQDWMTDAKIISMSSVDRLCFLTLLCLASSSSEAGVVRNCNEDTLIRLTHLYYDPYDDECDYLKAKGCLERYAALHCVTLSDNGDVTVVNFERRQGENLTGAERQKKYRESKKRLTQRNKPRNERDAERVTSVTLEENRIEENRRENIYGEFQTVRLTENEYQKLCEALTEPIAQSLIVQLDTYIKSKGVKYKNHYATLQAWARRRISEHQDAQRNAKPKMI